MLRAAVIAVALTMALPQGWCCWATVAMNDGATVAKPKCPACAKRLVEESPECPSNPSPDDDGACPCQSRIVLPDHSVKIFEWPTAVSSLSAMWLPVVNPSTSNVSREINVESHNGLRRHALLRVWRC